jgi:quercetin dioxygenase-like cupin family protein
MGQFSSVITRVLGYGTKISSYIWGEETMKTAVMATIIAFVIGPAIAAEQAQPSPPTVETKGLTRKLIYENVLSGPLTEINDKYKMTVAEFTIAPGGYVGPHLHAGPGYRCLIAGEVTNIEADGKTTVYHPGECYWEAGDKSHTPYNKGDRMVLGWVIELVPASLVGASIMPVPAAK